MPHHGTLEPGRQGNQEWFLPANPVGHALLNRTVNPNVRRAFEPPQGSRVEVVVRGEVAPVAKVVPNVPAGLTWLARRLGAVRTARPDAEAPVAAKAQISGFSASRPPSSRLLRTTTAFIGSNRRSNGTPLKYVNKASSSRITTGIVWRS